MEKSTKKNSLTTLTTDHYQITTRIQGYNLSDILISDDIDIFLSAYKETFSSRLDVTHFKLLGTSIFFSVFSRGKNTLKALLFFRTHSSPTAAFVLRYMAKNKIYISSSLSVRWIMALCKCAVDLIRDVKYGRLFCINLKIKGLTLSARRRFNIKVNEETLLILYSLR